MEVGNIKEIGKKSFVLYIDGKELWESLPDDQAGKLIKQVFRYMAGENPEPPDDLTKFLFIQNKSTLDRDQNKWQAIKEARSKSGKKGGRPPKANKADGFEEKQNEAKKANGLEEKQNEAIEAVIDNANGTATVIGNENVDRDLYDVDILLKKYLANEDLVEAAKQKMGFSGRSTLQKRLNEFNLCLKSKGQPKKTWNDYLSHFMYWDSKYSKSAQSDAPTFNSPVI